MDKMIKRESDYAIFERREHYIYVKHKPDIRVDLDAAKIHAKIILDLCNGYRYPIILDGRDVTANVSHDAREFIAKYEPVNKVRSAQAILVNNTATKLLANFYIKFHTPNHPVKVFSKFEDAEEWVKQFKVEKVI